MFRITRIMAAGSLLMFAFTLRTARANLISNGSFEIPVELAGTENDVPAGSPIGAWTVVGNDVGLLKSDSAEPGYGISAFNAEDGTQAVDLTGAENSGPTDGVTQSISTISGQSYVVSFWVGAASGDSPYYVSSATDDLSINGGPSISFLSLPSNPGGVNWTFHSYTFQASGSSTSITFLNGTSSPTAYAGLDNVSVDSAVPLPSAVGGGLVLAGALVARRMRMPRIRI
jgi:Protein of unknown function (DUF642)